MSSLKLLFSGSLVASGLILGAFALHGAFDSDATQRRSQAAGGQEPQSGPTGVAAFRTRTRLESGKRPLVRTSAKQEAGSADAHADEAKAARAEARRKQAEQKRAEKDEAEREKLAKANPEPPPQQATFQWPWDYWFNE